MQSASIQQLAAKLTLGAEIESQAQKAVILHDYVRSIPFGFTPWFDTAVPDRTMRVRRGHCIPKTALFVELLRASGIEAHAHLVNIRADILRGCLPVAPPAVVSHTYTEAKLDGKWVSCDSYIVDPALFAAAKQKLAQQGWDARYGTHARATIEWDGARDAFSQFAEPTSMLVADVGRVQDLKELWAHPQYQNRGGVGVFMPLRLLPMALWDRLLNSNVQAMRAGDDSNSGGGH